MPDFGMPFAGISLDRKLTSEELIRAVRFAAAAEFEAIQIYMQIAAATDHHLAKEVMTEVANEERIHVGEFLRLLKELAPDEERYYAEGAREVEEMMLKAG